MNSPGNSHLSRARLTNEGDPSEFVDLPFNCKEKQPQQQQQQEKFENESHLDEDEAREVRIASILFAVVGIGYLFPFSALTQPVDYWNLLFPDFNIEFSITAAFMYTNLLSLAVLVIFAGGTPNFTRRIVLGFIGQLLVLIVVPTSYFLHLEEKSNQILILCATMSAAIVTAFLDSVMFALAAQYPARVQESFQLGIGVSTLIGSLYRDWTKLVFPSSMLVQSSLLYFYAGAATIIFCIAAYYKLCTLNLTKKAFENAEGEAAAAAAAAATITPSESTSLISTIKKESENINGNKKESVSDRLQILRKILFNEIMVSLLFMSTLALWPPLVTEIPAYNLKFLEDSGWWGLILLTVFSIMDCVGRLMVQRSRCGLNKDNIWIVIIGRIIILFPLVLCSVLGIIFTNDIFSTLFVGMLGYTNGYVGTLSIVFINDCLESEQEQTIAGPFTAFFLNTGLVLGASIGLLLEKFLLKE